MKFISTLILFSISTVLFAQDLVITKEGKRYECKITSVQDSVLNIQIKRGNQKIRTTVSKNKTASYSINGTSYVNENGTFIKEIPGHVEPMNFPYLKEYEFADKIENNNQVFVYTKDKEVLIGETLEYQNKIFKGQKILLDSIEVKTSNALFFKNYNGYYANVAPDRTYGHIPFAKRVNKGKINLYEIRKNYTTFQPNGTMTSSSKTLNYHNIGFMNPEKTNFRSLSKYVRGHEKADLHLKKYQNINTSQILLNVIGAGLIVSGVAIILSRPEEQNPDGTYKTDYDDSVPIGLMLSGGAVVTVSFFVGSYKPVHLRRAVRAYNND